MILPNLDLELYGLGFVLVLLSLEDRGLEKARTESEFLDCWLFRWTFTGERFKDTGQ